ncbi:MAG: S41 family peptidase [Patescibacteria group bacterium]
MLWKKIIAGLVALIVVAALLGSGFLLGFNVGVEIPKKIIVEGVGNLDSQKPEAVDFGTFWQAWKTIDDEYLRSESVGPQERVYGAIRGLVGSLNDPYSEFFPPEDNKKFQEDIQGNFGGIGAELGIKNNQLVIIAPLKNTPASRVGLLPGDEILKINSTSTDGMAIEEAVRLIRGPIDTQVTLTIFREKWEKPKEFKIVRATITIPTIEAKIVDSDIVHIHLQSFNANANILFYQEMVKALSDGGAKGMILDLRNNPGGYLEVAVNLAGWFVPKGSLVVSERGRGDNTVEEFKASGNGALANFPVVVLINGGSASASEILAGALRDIRKIKLVGETSFGKGTVQQLESLPDGSSVKLTVAHWVLPGGGILDKGGLKPDVEIKLTDDDIKNKRDPQLDAAVKVLRSEILAK